MRLALFLIPECGDSSYNLGVFNLVDLMAEHFEHALVCPESELGAG
jgi:hypothetical protein